ncbi:MAG: DUF255 domain-containing protein [Saprospiraceae bacterium]|nr:DUF255 domain-containing protein [Saprospiraceae bacterium]
MRPLLRLIVCCFLSPYALLAQGIHFEQSTWNEVLARARTEGKVVFLDAVTAWCGPCKMMAKEVFPDSAAGAFFNRHFVSIKLDMERGEGVDISNRYKIWVYPTLLFVDSTGAMLHRSAGYHNPAELIDLGRTALDPTRNLAALERRYASGDRHREFVLSYLNAKTLAYDPDAGRLANDYLKTVDDMGTPENMDLLMRHVDDPYSDGFRYLLKNRAVFEEKYGNREVKAKIEAVFEGYLQRHPGLALGEIQRLYGTVYPERGEELASRYRIDYYRQKEDLDNFARSAIDHYQRFPTEDPDELNEMAWFFVEELKEPAHLQVAAGWSEKSIALQETYYNQYTYAKLLAKTGKKKAARKAAERSLELARAEGEDTTLIEELLESLPK